MRDRKFDGAKLRAARTDQGLTLRELASRSGVSLSCIKYVERGDRPPTQVNAGALARALGVTVDDLSSDEAVHEATPSDRGAA